jgi:hypothetical protein
VQGGYGVVFASHGTKVFEYYACRGTNGRRRQKSVTLLKLNGLHWCGVRMHEPVENVIGSRDKCKNHDKQLTFSIVRVIGRYIKFSFVELILE